MKQTISNFQATLILYTTIVPTAIQTIPSVVMTYSRQDAWIAIIASTLVGVCLALLIGTLARCNPGISLQAWIGEQFGRTAGTLAGLLLAFYYITISSVILKEFSGILLNQILPNTPPYIVMGIIVFVAGYAIVSGIEVIARVNVIVSVVSLIPYLISLALFADLIHFGHLFPMLQHKPATIAYSGLLPSGWFSEIAILLILSPYLQKRESARKVAVWGVVLSGLHLGVTVILAILVFGPDLPQLYQYPSFSMIEVIRIGTVLERIDILFEGFWICTIYLKMALFLFGAYECLLHALRLKPSRPVLGVLLLWIMLTSLFAYRDQMEFGRLNQLGTPYELLAFNVLLPLLMGLGLLIRKKRKSKGEALT
jgi:spore germination protein KB